MDSVISNIQRDVSRRYFGAAKPRLASHRKAKNVKEFILAVSNLKGNMKIFEKPQFNIFKKKKKKLCH